MQYDVAAMTCVHTLRANMDGNSLGRLNLQA